MTRKVVINHGVGRFSLSKEAFLLLRGLDEPTALNETFDEGSVEAFCSEIMRDDEKLLFIVEGLRERANGVAADLCVVEIPDDVDWQVVKEHSTGREWVAERHKTWGKPDPQIEAEQLLARWRSTLHDSEGGD